MNRRIRSSRRAAARASLLCLALGLVTAACSSDLFHDTKWQSRCDTEPDAAICPQGTGGAGGAGSASSASSTSSASSASSSSASSASSSASSTAGVGGAGGAASMSTGTSMMASSSTGP